MPDALGYARVFTAGQDLEAQSRRLRAGGGVLRVFEDVASGRSFNRPGLAALLDYARPGDTVCVVRLDRLDEPGPWQGLLRDPHTSRLCGRAGMPSCYALGWCCALNPFGSGLAASSISGLFAGLPGVCTNL